MKQTNKRKGSYLQFNIRKTATDNNLHKQLILKQK